MKKAPFPKLEGSILKRLGPSIVTIGLGIGSGEFILWPFLAAHYGFGILWGALIGITFQLIIIIEIQRFTVTRGINILKGMEEIWSHLPLISLFLTILGFGWPGFAASSAQLSIALFGISTSNQSLLSIVILTLCGLILISGPNSYKRIETIQKIVVPINFLLLSYIFISFFDFTLFKEMLLGFLGIGNGYKFFPPAIQLATFIGAFAYAGSGGNMLLGQSFYSVEKRYGLTIFSKPLDLWKKEKEDFQNIEVEPEVTKESKENHRQLLKFISIENAALFWGVGLLTITMLSYIAYVTVGGKEDLPEGFGFLIYEAGQIGNANGWIWEKIFLAIGVFSLLSVQLGILDLIGRISTIVFTEVFPDKTTRAKAYIYTVICEVVLGTVIYFSGIKEPFFLIITGAVINALVMAILTILLLVLNIRHVPAAYSMPMLNRIMLVVAFLFYIVLFVMTILRFF